MTNQFDGEKKIKKARGWIYAILAIIAAICVALWLHGFKDVNISSPGSSLESVPVRTVQNDVMGISISVPVSWYLEGEGSDTFMVYADYDPGSSSSAPHCEFEVATFPFVGNDRAGWIASRIGKDPTLEVHEQSSAEIPVGNISGIQWTGSISGVSTTLIYAFAENHAYEIAMLDANGREDGPSVCAPVIGTFLAGMNFSDAQN